MTWGAAIRAFVATAPAAGRCLDAGRVVSQTGHGATILLATGSSTSGRGQGAVAESPPTAAVHPPCVATAVAATAERAR